MEFLYRAFAAPDSSGATAEGAAPAAGGTGAFGLIIWVVILFAMFYFLIIMPQRRRDKQYKSMMSQLKMGDKIVTIGGIVGKVTALKNDQTVEIQTVDTKMEITRKAISAILGKSTKDPNEAVQR
ncbi:MAG TPA: preprotein translocase subunit YajC [Thermotogota bacterium]|nr:preprotein translocase subunit YajC [Thermotogota bacterium]HRW91610.1 preprotein translocase subunit YajC [Thermotogota bacterium]